MRRRWGDRSRNVHCGTLTEAPPPKRRSHRKVSASPEIMILAKAAPPTKARAVVAVSNYFNW